MENNSTGNQTGFWYKYPHPAVTADCVIFGFNGKGLNVLLVERGNEPYLGCWALPGGFMRIDESIEQAAARELHEETNLQNIYLEQFKVFSRPDRDPRERVVTVAFIALVKPDDYEVIAGDDAANALWFDAKMLPPLAFDHREIIRDAREYLKEILRLKPVAFELLNKVFTIGELQSVYEVINETSYDRRNFLRTAIDSEAITEVQNPGIASTNGGRPVKFYTSSLAASEPEPTPELENEPEPEAGRLACPPCLSATTALFDSAPSLTVSESDSEIAVSDSESEIASSSMFEEEGEADFSSDEDEQHRRAEARHSEKLRRRMKIVPDATPKAPTKGLFDFFRRK